MTTIYCTKLTGPTGLAMLMASDKWSEAELLSWADGTDLRVQVSRPRNPQHHRKAMALLRYLVDNTDDYRNVDHCLVDIKFATGHVEKVWTYDHTRNEFVPRVIPKSISFTSMSQDEFEDWYEAALDVIAERMACEPDEVRRGAEEMMK